MQEVAPGIFVESEYPPYNLALITGDNGAIAVDIPPCPSHAREWLSKAQDAVGKIRYAVLTDANPERLAAATLWKIPLIATEHTARTIATVEERAWRELLQAVADRYPEEAEEIARLKPHRITLAFNQRLLLYHRTPPLEFEVIAGADSGSLWIIVPEHNLLLTGDTVVAGAPPLIERTPDSKEWLNTLANLARRTTIHQIVPGRGKAAILRGEIEQQREFLRVMRRTARTLARSDHSGGPLAQAAQDLGQTFFNQLGQKAVKRIKPGLQHLVQEMLAAKDASEDE